MRTLLWILLSIVALLTIPVVFPPSEPASVTTGQIFAAIVFYPCVLLAGLGIFISIVDLFRWSVPHPQIFGMLALSAVFPVAIIARITQFEASYDTSYAWFDQSGGPGKLNYHIHDYVTNHPDAVTYPIDGSEEVSIEGFLDYLKSVASLEMPDHSGRVRRMKIKSDGIYTSWGAKIHFAIDRNEDGFIESGGQRASTRYGFISPYTDRPDYEPGFASAVFVPLPDQVLKDSKSSLVTLDEETFDRLKPVIMPSRK